MLYFKNRKGHKMTSWDITIDKITRGQKEERKIDLIGDYNF